LVSLLITTMYFWGDGLGESKVPCIRWEARSPHGKGVNFGGIGSARENVVPAMQRQLN